MPGRRVLFATVMMATCCATAWPQLPNPVTPAVPNGPLSAEAVGLTGPLRRAITDLQSTFGPRYPKGQEYITRLDAIGRELSQAGGGRKAALEEELAALRREALTANPLLAGRRILFVARPQYRAVYHAIDTLSQVGEATEGSQPPGAALKTIDLASGTVTTLLDSRQGFIRDPEVSFDAKTILVSMRRNMKENLHLFEARADGTGLHQLTTDPGVSDFDAAYLPDGGIVFSSTREPKFNMCSQDIGANLFRMDGDGANILQITKNTLFDNQSTVLPDGRILYSRWEYVDRNFGDAHGLWTVNPDGTNQAVVYKNNTASPPAVYYGKPIPGTPEYVGILSTHHGNMWGALATIDPRRAVDGKGAILRTWPEAVFNGLRDDDGFNCDELNGVTPKYETPHVLYDPEAGRWSNKYFLCSRTVTPSGPAPRPGEILGVMGIYLVDVFGNEVLLHAESPGCFGPVVLAPRPRPPVIPARRSFDSSPGLVCVANVYEGTHMKGVKPRAVKKLRVVESTEKRGWCNGKWNGQGFMAPGMNWMDFTAKRILGTVPVESDGSACFEVPAETFVYFQLLDENDMMIQSMRSGTVLQPGEKVGCVGCHDSRRSAPPVQANAKPLAMGRARSRIEPWYGPARSFDYVTEVQPVFDKNCVRCHDFGKPGGEKLVLAGDKDPFFNASYTQLWRKGYIRAIGAGPAGIQQAYSWGANASKIVQVIRAGHNQVKLDKESFSRLATWIDINAPYYSTYYCAYPDNIAGRCPLDNGQLGRLGQLTGVDFNQQSCFGSSSGPMVSFDRPPLSPCLGKLDKNGPPYIEALAIIQAGKDMLAKRPRADMPGFMPCEKDRQREAFYVSRRQIELRNRQAIREGKKVYDPGVIPAPEATAAAAP